MQRSLKNRRRVLVKGPVGVGKTFALSQACQRIDWDLITLCSPLQSPVKVGGYPMQPKELGGDATHCLFDGIARAFRATRPTCLFWDDLAMAGGETLKAIIEMIQFGKIDGKVLPDCVVQAAATNDIGHGADVQGMIEPLKTRWHTIIPVEPHIEDTIAYGLARNWPSDLLAFLRNSPGALHDWKPSKDVSINGATPRGWEYVAEWINLGEDDSEVLAGCVGKGQATAYLAFRGLIGELPDVDACLLDPESSPVPENPSAKWLVSMALASKMTAQNFGQAVKYLNRLDTMFRAFAIRDAFRGETAKRKDNLLPKDYKPLSGSRDYTAWVVSSDGKAVMSAAA
jgi:hypothetical protein